MSETIASRTNRFLQNRAIIYWLIFDELRNHCGEGNAEEIMGQAIYRRGQQKGREKYAQFAPNDLEGVKRAFLSGHADEGRMFQPEVVHQDAGRLDVKHHKCPLLEAWQELGLADDDVATLCRIAARSTTGRSRPRGSAFLWTPGGPAAIIAACCTSPRGSDALKDRLLGIVFPAIAEGFLQDRRERLGRKGRPAKENWPMSFARA